MSSSQHLCVCVCSAGSATMWCSLGNMLAHQACEQMLRNSSGTCIELTVLQSKADVTLLQVHEENKELCLACALGC